MAVYIVDFENVKSKGLNGIDNLEAEDNVFVFYSENAETITFDVHRKMKSTPANIIYFEVKVGSKNALDFQLSSYLGFLIAKDPENQYHIVSDDTGFDSVVHFWKQNSKSIDRVSDLALKNKLEEHKERIRQIESIIPQYIADAPTIGKYIADYKTKQGLNNALVKKYDSKKAGEIYKAIKPLLVDKKGK